MCKSVSALIIILGLSNVLHIVAANAGNAGAPSNGESFLRIFVNISLNTILA